MSNDEDYDMPVRVTEHDGWRTVHYGAWSVGVDDNGVLHCPRHVRPDKVDEFVGAVLMAAQIGKRLRAPDRPRPLPLQINQYPDWFPRP